MNVKAIALTLSAAAIITACGLSNSGQPNTTDDPTFSLTGTEQLPLVLEDGGYVCPSPKKVLICHIPPGNPANAHTICVAVPAVEAHQGHHGDTDGACAETDAGIPPETSDDAGTTDPVDAGDPTAGVN
jgi:hypothetical protein